MLFHQLLTIGNRELKKCFHAFLQARFANVNVTLPTKTLWQIPLSYTTSMEMNFDDTRAKIWLNDSSTEIRNINLTNNHWLMFNLHTTGKQSQNFGA